jgi:hypothetical protein
MKCMEEKKAKSKMEKEMHDIEAKRKEIQDNIRKTKEDREKAIKQMLEETRKV